jgi:hypothetical protein
VSLFGDADLMQRSAAEPTQPSARSPARRRPAQCPASFTQPTPPLERAVAGTGLGHAAVTVIGDGARWPAAGGGAGESRLARRGVATRRDGTRQDR